jgi:ribosomal protein S18 acetylase RimI-like enzyme
VSNIVIDPLRSEQRDAAARVLARAFITNPLHIAAFGAPNFASNEIFFRAALAVMKGPKLVAIDGSRILGVIHWVRSPNCQFSGAEKLRMAPAMLKGLGLLSRVKVGSWMAAWSKYDPAEPHIHLGPIGVDPEAQGRGIGRRLMERYCEELNRAAVAGYLETDRWENVDFYKRFGFHVVETAPVLGVDNYFMWRAINAVVAS